MRAVASVIHAKNTCSMILSLFGQHRTDLIFLSFCHLSFPSVAEDMINPRVWQKDISWDYPKFWLNYSEAFAEKLSFSSQFDRTVVEVLEFMSQNSKSDQVIRRQQGGDGSHLQKQVLVILSAQMKIPAGYRFWFTGTYSYKMQLFWKFKMFTDLSHKASLVQFKLFGDFVLCDFHFASSSQLNTLTFCGVFSNLEFYPGTPNVVYTLTYFPKPGLVFSVLLDVITVGVLCTKVYTFSLHKPLRKLSTNFFLVQKDISVYQVESKKYLTVYLFVSQTPSVTLTFFLGPGRLSPSQTVNQTKFHYTCHTYICFISALTPLDKKDSLLLKYFFLNRSFKWQTVGLKRLNLKISTPNQVNSLFSLHAYNSTSKKYHIKASVQNFSLSAFTEHRCMYGGISFYAFADGLSEETRVCTLKKNYFETLRNVYSQDNRMLIVAYAHSTYAELNATVEISFTPCFVEQTNLCQLREQRISRGWDYLIRRMQVASQTAGDFVKFVIPTIVIGLDHHRENCSIVHLYLKAVQECHKIAWLAHFPLDIMVFQFFVFLKLDAGFAEYKYTFQGVLSGDPDSSVKRRSWQSALLTSGKDLQFNKNKDITIVVWKHNTKETGGSSLLLFPKDLYKEEMENSDFTPLFGLKPHRLSEWFFTLRFREVASQSSMAFKLQVTDQNNWLDLVTHVEKRQRTGSSEIPLHTNIPVHSMCETTVKKKAFKITFPSIMNLRDNDLQIKVSTQVRMCLRSLAQLHALHGCHLPQNKDANGQLNFCVQLNHCNNLYERNNSIFLQPKRTMIRSSLVQK